MPSSAGRPECDAVVQMETDEAETGKYEDLSSVAQLAASQRYQSIMEVRLACQSTVFVLHSAAAAGIACMRPCCSCKLMCHRPI